MSTITKEHIANLLQFNSEGSDCQANAEQWEVHELARIALASLEAEDVAWMWERDGKRDVDMDNPDEGINRIGAKKAMDAGWKCNPLYTAPPAPARSEPIAWLWSHRKHPSEVTLVRPEDDERAEGAHWSGWSCQALYAAPPAPVSVPKDIPDSVFEVLCQASGGGGKACDFADELWNACRAAMLQGAEPVTTAYKLPPESPYGYFAYSPTCGEEFFKRREDAVELCKDAIEEFRRDELNEGVDPAEVRRVCWGVIMQSGIDITVDDDGHIDYSLTPELIGNSPVIPDGWVACSERMPEIGIKVLCFPVNDEPIHATYNGQVWLQDISWSTSDEPIDNVISCNVFHWMPLPVAPQQEVKP